MIDASESNLRKNRQFINGESLGVPGYDTHDGGRIVHNRTNLNDVLPVSTGIKGHDKISAALLASCVASLASVIFGYTMGYTSPTQQNIEKELMSSTQFSWFAVSPTIFYAGYAPFYLCSHVFMFGSFTSLHFCQELYCTNQRYFLKNFLFHIISNINNSIRFLSSLQCDIS